MSPTIALWLLTVLATVPTPFSVRASVDRSLPLLLKAAEGHIGKQTCFACHNQALPMVAFHAARERGFTVKAEELKEQTDFVYDFLKRNKEKFKKGEGTGGQVDSAGYALVTVELGGRKPDDVTAAVAEYLLNYQPKIDHWRAVSNRPPSEASHFTPTYLALRGLRVFGTAEQKEAIAKRVDATRAWLLKTPALDTEDRVFRLLAMKEAGVEGNVIRAAANSLRILQRSDGGWSQLDGGVSDAYATGSALVALNHVGGLSADDAAYQCGLGFLLRNQRADGSWFIKSRSKPFQPYYESGFPHGNDQFISAAASGWATAALAAATKK
jgi:Squalene-hopene cyclase C-terminal domain